MATIYHNPRCSKSRCALGLLQERGVDVDLIEYLKTPPTAAELDDLCTRLGIEPMQLIRTKEKLFTELGLSVKDDRTRTAWLDLLAAHPKLIERPIVVVGDRAVIGRPPEKVLELLP